MSAVISRQRHAIATQGARKKHNRLPRLSAEPLHASRSQVLLHAEQPLPRGTRSHAAIRFAERDGKRRKLLSNLQSSPKTLVVMAFRRIDRSCSPSMCGACTMSGQTWCLQWTVSEYPVGTFKPSSGVYPALYCALDFFQCCFPIVLSNGTRQPIGDSRQLGCLSRFVSIQLF